ncbi:hypothetical protein Tco_0662968 [Tanacetum coccineum]
MCEDLGKLKPKADIGIFVGYALANKAFRIYNKRTRLIIETIHVDFDELTTMASEQFSLGPRHKLLTPETISSGLVQNIPSSTSYVPPTKNDWDILFQRMFNEYLNPPPCIDPQVPTVIAPEPTISTFHHNVYSPPSSIPQIEYAPTVNQQQQQLEFSQLYLGLTVLVFKQGPTLEEQVEAILGNKGLLFVTTAKGKDTCLNSALKLKVNGMIRDPGTTEGQAIQIIITHNAIYQANDLDAYDFDWDELKTAKDALMANLSHYGSDALAEVHNPDNVDNNMINQGVQVIPSSEQSNVVNHSKTKITSDSNIIPYS